MLPNELWGSCHEVTEGAAMQSIAVEGADYRKIVGKWDFKTSLSAKLTSLLVKESIFKE